MFGFFSPTPRRSTVVRSLFLESLETRDCPSTFVPTTILPVDLNAAGAAQQLSGAPGPYTVSMGYTFQSGHNIEVTGSVSGPSPGGQMVEFEGPINGYVMTDPSGSFDFTTPAAYLGTMLAAVLPSPGVGVGSGGGVNTTSASPGGTPSPVGSNVASVTLVDTAPVISDFTMTQINSVAFEFTGQVTAGYAQGLTVSFGGQVVDLQGQAATVAANGTFALFINLTGSSDTGLATAQILADNWGLQSNQVSLTVAS